MKKQVLCGALAVAAASFVAISAQGTEASAKMSAGAITIDCESQTMTLGAGAGEGSQFFVGTGKYTPAGKKAASLKVASWEIYDKVGDVTVDLSKLNKQVDNYVVVKDAPTGNPVIIKIPAAKKTIAAAYDKATGTIKVTDSKAPYATTGEYRSSTSTKWTTADSNEEGILGTKDADGEWENADISMYQRLGATLYYRVKATSQTYTLKKTATENFAYDTETAASDHTVYQVPAFAGVEKKVTVAALAKGPKITVNYAAHTATFVKDTQYRFVPEGTGANTLAEIDFADVTLDAKNKVEAVTIDANVLAKGGFVESRIKAVAPVDGKGGKLASKVTQTYFNAIGTTVVKDKKDITVDQTVTIDTDLELKSDAAYVAKGKTAGYLKVTFTNNSTDKYEYLTVAPAAAKEGEEDATPAASVKVSGAIAAKNAKGKAGSKALTLAPGTKIYVRKVATNPSKTVAIGVWSTNWAEVATITAKPTDTPAPTEPVESETPEE